MKDMLSSTNHEINPDAGHYAAELAPGKESNPEHCLHCHRDISFSGASISGFCCSGCESVYRIITQCGLGKYYDLRQLESREWDPADSADPRSFAHFDDPAFKRNYVEAKADGMLHTELYLENVRCAACLWVLERLPHVVRGIIETRLDLSRSLLEVTWDPKLTSLAEIARFLKSIDYTPHPFRGVNRRNLRRQEERLLLTRIGIAGACAGNIMLLAVCLYAGWFSGIEAEYEQTFRWLSLLISLPVVFWSGQVFFRGAISSLRLRRPHIDVPLALGIALAFTASAFNVVRGTGGIYFDSITALIFLLLIGRWLQLRTQRVATEAQEFLYSFIPSWTRRVVDENIEEVAVESLLPGDVVLLLPSETCPVDGKVVKGRGIIDRSALTGESRPLEVVVGDTIEAGVISVSSPLNVQVERAGEETRLGRLMQLVERSIRERAPVVELTDRIGGYFVVGVIAIAGAAFALGAQTSLNEGFERALAMLIVTCPCALGLATPLALTSALGRAARRGIFIKGGSTLEALSRTRRMIFDKTGTLTEGKFKVVSWDGVTGVAPLVAALEAHSVHLFAVALVKELGGSTSAQLNVTDVQEHLGAGISGLVGGRNVAVGSRRLMEQLGIEITPEWSSREGKIREQALSHAYVAVGGDIVALIGLGDPVRPEASPAISRLQGLDIAPHLLSGDLLEVVQKVGSQLGIPSAELVGDATPEAKLTYVQSYHDGGTAMVGDGINDAAALASADVGIAVHGGAEASLAASDVFLTKPRLNDLVTLVEGARLTTAVIRRNLLISFGYNIVGAGLAFAGLINPLIAAVLMPLSSLSVVISSNAHRAFSEPISKE